MISAQDKYGPSFFTACQSSLTDVPPGLIIGYRVPCPYSSGKSRLRGLASQYLELLQQSFSSFEVKTTKTQKIYATSVPNLLHKPARKGPKAV